MTRKEAKDKITELAKENFWGCGEWLEALETAIEALEQEPKWIPVSERLPDKDGLYLVSVKNDHLRRYSKTCWYSDENWFARQDVVAWQPLPKPYKAESET